MIFGVDFHSRRKCSAEGFECALNDVVGVFACKFFYVKSDSCIVDKCDEKLFDKFGIEVAHSA